MAICLSAQNMSKLLLATAFATLVGTGARAADGPIFRHAADAIQFSGGEATTAETAQGDPTLLPDGAIFYTRSVTVPGGQGNAMYITMFGTGDTHGGAGEWFSCRVNKINCKPAGTTTGVDQAPVGWITLIKIPAATEATNCNDGGGGTADCHDNAISYEWCQNIGPSSVDRQFNVVLKMATSIAGQSVFLEKARIYIDSSAIASSADRCKRAGEPGRADAASGLLATTVYRQK